MIDDMQISPNVRDIYNTYLRVTRTARDLRWRPRKDFSKFSDTQLVQCEKLNKFFKQYPHISQDLYFEAPFKIIKDFTPMLKFYCNRVAMSCYTQYLQYLQDLSPDDEWHISGAKKSIKHIIKHCASNEIPWDAYIESSKYIPHWLSDYKRRDVSLYVLMTFPNFKNKVDCLEKDVIILYMPEYMKYVKYKRAFNNSKKLKPFLEKALPKCRNITEKNLTK